MTQTPRARLIAEDTFELDLLYLGRPRWIATALLRGPGGIALIDPGPASALPALRAAVRDAGATMDDLCALVLTHIHLDHAGATGVLVRERPGLEVFVHRRGARHLIDPAKLLASATRLYGEAMDRLWGEVAPVPEAVLRPLAGAEDIRPAGHRLDVADTPGHASHHLSFFQPHTGIAYVGDTAGVRIAGARFVLPVTPPPDIDVPLWIASLDRIRAWMPRRLFVTHFGVGDDAAWHLDAMQRRLQAWAARVRDSLQEAGDDDARARGFTEWVQARLRHELGDAEAERYIVASGGFDDDWYGLARYWRQAEAAPG
jgi:glyoxylase-like metal-dependent hydrolase (beta-lactamase superfamily II)